MSFTYRTYLSLVVISGAARISLRGAKFFEQLSPDAVEKPSECSHNKDIEIFSPRDERCVQDVKKFNAIAHIKNFALAQLHATRYLIQTHW